MTVYMVWLWDWWWEQQIPIGVFTTEENASAAAEIAIEQKRKEEPENVPDDRYEVNIEETILDGYSVDLLRCFREA